MAEEFCGKLKAQGEPAIADFLRDLALQYKKEMLDKVEWISVKDNMPESDYKYLVFVDGYIDYFLFCDEGYWCKYLGLVDMSESVTHWMPPPIPPNENKMI